jgi:type II secretory pathway pseudopilin PulG
MRDQRGTTLLEVLIGMVIFALGIMALAQLQGNLSKGSADSNARTVAINVAEEIIEEARSFSQVTADPDLYAFNNIVSGDRTVTRGGIDYAVRSDVTDYYYNPATSLFQPDKPNPRLVNADLKMLQLTVTWGAGQTFQIDETQSSGNLGTGSITLTDMISSIPALSVGKVLLNATTSGLFSPPVDYLPGQNPDIISIKLGDNRFKESTTPLPDVIRSNELVETRFDVVTYSQSDSGATFLRREEFLAVSCECRLRVADADGEGGRRPTVWNGNDYTEGEIVAKTFGESNNQQQSSFCDLCCRDHHDGGVGENDTADSGRSRYNPFRGSTEYWTSADSTGLTGDHKHYSRDRNGNLLLADSDGAVYAEACRMVRKDGFLRVAQDMRQEGMNSFPADYLDDETEVAEYSKYVTDAVAAFEAAVSGDYEQSPPTLTEPQDMVPAVTFPASTPQNATTMSGGSQQLRNRGIYVDYLTDELRTIVNCMDQGGTGSSCGVTGANTALEVLPFYDVQLTWLARWNETPTNAPVDVSNEAIQDSNTHSRGIATVTIGFGYSTINTAAHRGNLGLTGTDPIDPWFGSGVRDYNLYALASSSTTPPPSGGYVIRGEILSAVNGVKAADVEIEATEALCDRTLTGYECVVQPTATNPRLKVYNYFKLNRELFGCSDVLTVQGVEHSGTDPTHSWTRFNLPKTNLDSANILIKEGSCI